MRDSQLPDVIVDPDGLGYWCSYDIEIEDQLEEIEEEMNGNVIELLDNDVPVKIPCLFCEGSGCRKCDYEGMIDESEFVDHADEYEKANASVLYCIDRLCDEAVEVQREGERLCMS